MKYSLFFSVVFALLMHFSPEAKAQVKVDVKDKVNHEADNRANRATDRVIDAGFDKIEEGIKGVFKKKDKKTKDDTNEEEAASENDAKVTDAETNEPGKKADNKSIQKSSPVLSWSKYDFVPGDQVIFEDNLEKEENGEFPSRWDLRSGNVEVAELDGEKVIMLRDGSPEIVPYFKDPGEDHLPDVFTIELDLLYKGEYPFEIYLYDRKNQESKSPTGYHHVITSGNQMRMGTATSEYPDKAKDPDVWRHISIAYTDGKLKAYLDDTRLINIPQTRFQSGRNYSLCISCFDENHCYVKECPDCKRWREIL